MGCAREGGGGTARRAGAAGLVVGVGAHCGRKRTPEAAIASGFSQEGPTTRNARWRLEAVDFFNDDLVRFLSFNNAILASIEDVIIVADPAGRVVYQNPAAHGLDGYREQPPFAPEYLRLLLDGRSFIASFGGVFSESGTANMGFVPAHDGNRRYNVTLARNRQGRRRRQSLHDATAQYELNQAKNDMVSLVSHELRTPLTAIRGYSDMLLKYDLRSGKKAKPFHMATIIDESQPVEWPEFSPSSMWRTSNPDARS